MKDIFGVQRVIFKTIPNDCLTPLWDADLFFNCVRYFNFSIKVCGGGWVDYVNEFTFHPWLTIPQKGSLDRTQRMEIESGALTLTKINCSTRSRFEPSTPLPLYYSNSLQFIRLSLLDPSFKSGIVNIATRCPPPSHNLMTLFFGHIGLEGM